MRLIVSMVLLFSLRAFGASITPAQYLAAKTPPVFKSGHRLLPLSVWYYAKPSTNLMEELSRNWGYALHLGNGSAWETPAHNFTNMLADPNSSLNFYMNIVTNNPGVYKTSIGVNQRYFEPRPTDLYVTNSAGEWTRVLVSGVTPTATNVWATTNGATLTISPEGNQEYWTNAAVYWKNQIQIVQDRVPIDVIYNGGEYGLGVFFGGNSHTWNQDPRVQARFTEAPWNTYTKGDGSSSTSWKFWFDYGSYRRQQQYQPLTDLIRAMAPDRKVYIHYETAGEQVRTLNVESETQWATGNYYNGYYTRTLSDFPNFEIYFKHFNTGFIGNGTLGGQHDMLTKYLNAIGAHINYGSPTNYSWVSNGYTRTGTNDLDYGNITNYTGLLKCLYTGGMIGANNGFYGPGDDDVAFDETSPPMWLQAQEALGRVHALFSHLDAFLFEGSVLGGTGNHSMSVDQPSYEYITMNTNNRVMARKLTATNEWIVTAWAADGITTNITVTIPILGTKTITADADGNVYRGTVAQFGPVNELGEIATLRRLRVGSIRGR